jgi:hypothetical protein
MFGEIPWIRSGFTDQDVRQHAQTPVTMVYFITILSIICCLIFYLKHNVSEN